MSQDGVVIVAIYLFLCRSMKELFKICRERSRVKYTMTVSDCAPSSASRGVATIQALR